MSTRGIYSVLIGLVVPLTAIVGLFPITSKVQMSVLGFPFLYFWIFLWFGLTSVCLWISWYGFDRHKYVIEAEQKEE